MKEVKGGIVINQMKDYAKRLSDATGSSAMVQIDVWHHKYGDGESFNVYTKAFSCLNSDDIKPRFDTEDLRDLGEAINDYIDGNSKTGKENENG